MERISTFCRICEPQCGINALVDNGRFIGVEANKEHVSSQGHFCKKSVAMVDVVYDEDRVTQPLKRTGAPGEFESISWEQAYAEIGHKLKKIRGDHGKASLATYLGNPAYYSYATVMWHELFTKTLGVKWKYHVHAEDGGALIATNSLLYGSGGLIPLPDLWHTDFLLVIGANPVVSHGSSFSEPRSGSALNGIKQRGGRILVVDPRKNETANGNDYLAINAGSDANLVCALIHEVIAKDLCDKRFIRDNAFGFEMLKDALRECTPEWAEELTGISANETRRLAFDFATAKSACIHTRMGTSAQRYGTLATTLLHTLCIITGNLDRRGGMLFGAGYIDAEKLAGDISVGKNPSRVDQMPDVAGQLPSTALVNDILVPGKDQIKALVMVAANPVLASPAGGGEMENALSQLDLFISQDIYINESNKFADYILPSTTWLESDGIPFISMGMMLRPTMYGSRAVIERVGDTKEDWEILDGICEALGYGTAVPAKPLQLLAKLGLRLKPSHIVDILIRIVPGGNKFGLSPKGLTFKKLKYHLNNGVKVRDELPVGVLQEKLETRNKKINLAQPKLLEEIVRLREDQFYRQKDFPFKLSGMRQKSAHNSWLHNVPSLSKDHQDHRVRINPIDAKQHNICDGDAVKLCSPYGEITTTALVTDCMKVGNLALPHGWGHDGSWRLANAIGGSNSNILASSNPDDAEKIAGMATLNGIPVQISKVHEKIFAKAI